MTEIAKLVLREEIQQHLQNLSDSDKKIASSRIRSKREIFRILEELMSKVPTNETSK